MNSINRVNFSPNFKALRISPAPDYWNQRVLNAALNSNFVRDIVKEDAKNERDTIISYADHYDPAYPDYTRYNHMFFNIKGNDKDITLGSHSTYRYESAQFFKKAKIIKTGADDLGEDLATQIEKLDGFDKRKKQVHVNNRTLAYYKKLAGDIIVEKQKDYEQFKS